MPLVMKEIEAKTEDPGEKATISKILQMKELSLSKYPLVLTSIFRPILWKNMHPPGCRGIKANIYNLGMGNVR
jgi:hypothetical protein